MLLLHPTPIDTEKRFIAESIFEVDLTENRFKVKMRKSVSVLFVSKERLEKSDEFVYLTTNTKQPPKEKMDDYLSMQTLIRICAENGEAVNRRLLKINQNLIGAPLSDWSKIMKMDFMSLKDNFIEYIKKDQLIKTVDEYSSNAKMKPFRKNLDEFIIDRNIYTHGHLHLLDPDYSFVIEYINNVTKQKVYAKITTEVLVTYNQLYVEIIRFFDTFTKLKQEQREKK
ncbi:MAG: hypothetical protein QM725_05670 [Lacibacter sp.]